MSKLTGVVNPDCGYRLAEPDVIHQLFGEEIVAIDLRSGGYFSLSPVTGQVWLLLAGEGARIDAVVLALTRRYGLPPERLLGDLEPLFSQLLELELIVPCAAPPPPRQTPTFRRRLPPTPPPACRPTTTSPSSCCSTRCMRWMQPPAGPIRLRRSRHPPIRRGPRTRTRICWKPASMARASSSIATWVATPCSTRVAQRSGTS